MRNKIERERWWILCVYIYIYRERERDAPQRRAGDDGIARISVIFLK